jgi:hypothetical protein
MKFLQSTLVAVLKHRNHICPMFPPMAEDAKGQ